MASSDSRELVALIRAAARQRRLMVPWEKDKQFVAEGGKIAYAADADILTLYTAPWDVAVRKKRREGYAQIFPEDQPWLVEAIGRALADHIFFGLAANQPLLVIPPIEWEIRRVYAAVARKAHEEHHRAHIDIQKLRRRIEEMESASAGVVDVARLTAAAPDLVRILRGQAGPSAELKRFGHLLSRSRIAAPLAYALEQNRIEDPSLRDALADPKKPEHIGLVREWTEDWRKRLLATKSEDTHELNVLDDAKALARLQWINNRLEKTHRVVLITGDSAVRRAAERYFANAPEEDSFADRYLRHPRAFLAEPSVLFPGSTKSPDEQVRAQKELIDWLDGLLALFSVMPRDYYEELHEVAEPKDVARRSDTNRSEQNLAEAATEALRLQPDIIDEFRKCWQKHNHTLVVYHLRKMQDEEDPEIEKILRDLERYVDQAADALNEKIHENWDRFFEAAFEAGYGLLFYRPQSSPMPPRSPPLLSFDTFPKFFEIEKEILQARRAGNLEPGRYAAMRQEVLDEDHTRYTYYLLHAVLFAAEQGWRVAAILARRASDIARQPKPDAAQRTADTVTGREAVYLEAVALRHAARKTSDLASVGPLLQRAEECLEKELETRPNLKAGKIRFEAERHALDVSYHMFHEFKGQALPLDVPGLAEIQTNVADLLSDAPPVDKDKIQFNREAFISYYTQRALLTNLFMVSLLIWTKQPTAYDSALMRDHLARFRTFIDHPADGIPVTFLVKAVYLAAEWWLAQPARKRECRRALWTHFEGEAIDHNTILPYDQQRFAFLRDLPDLPGR